MCRAKGYVLFSGLFGLKTGIHFAHFGLESGMVFVGTTGAYERIYHFTALFTNMRILKFKSQLTIAFFAAVNHLNGPLRKQNFSLTGSKGHGL